MAMGVFIFWKLPPAIGGAYISTLFRQRRGSICGESGRSWKWGQGKQPYHLPPPHDDFAGVIVSLARQQEPDTSPTGLGNCLSHFEISPRRLRAQIFFRKSHRRAAHLLSKEVVSDFLATQPYLDKPTS